MLTLGGTPYVLDRWILTKHLTDLLAKQDQVRNQCGLGLGNFSEKLGLQLGIEGQVDLR